ncbi:NAD(P)-dependent oxidoreductase [Pseudactinotalea sp. HY158]|uniref:NAD(P)-dependent oxidoreductase n=1 Tax=Pseudactinotalea sp. HY158 TaxID=2654547 RepID=UPI00129D153F|nr:NAD(P)-dependent oxidoreductase [Pseudactinotalea sp. HY158]QGH70894.1 NAD-binding protein [Pseudactinotalea sp. HY158]
MSQECDVGIIGLGAMGTPMTHRMLAAGLRVAVTSRRPKNDLLTAGAQWFDSPRELGDQCSTVLLMVPDFPEIEQVCGGPDGVLASEGRFLLMIGATVDASETGAFATRVEQLSNGRIGVVDCPVSGGTEGASTGQLSIMLGGTVEHTTTASRVLRPCGEPVRVGPIGAGQVAKACNQLVVASTMMAIGEASVLAARSGIDLGALWDLLGHGYAGSALLEVKRDRIVNDDYAPGGAAKYMSKDLESAAGVAAATNTTTVLLGPLADAYAKLVARGYGDDDLAVTKRFIESG